jgi:predicted nucleotidyltransferase
VNVEEDLDLIDAVIYGDAFDCAVTFDEIWRYSRIPTTRAQLRDRLQQPMLNTLVGERDGYYFLNRREHLADRRKDRLIRAQRLKKRARHVARMLQHFPFVRGIVLTGSVAVDDAEEDADVDMLIIVAEGRIGLSFLLLATLSRLLSRQVFCPNYYMSQAHLSVSRQDRYVARELVQAEPLTSQAGALLAANPWAHEHLPNSSLTMHPVNLLPGGALLQRILELPFSGQVGARCERKARNIVERRLRAHHGAFQLQVPEEVRRRFELGIELRFHGAPRVNDCVERYDKNRKELAHQMREARPTEIIAQRTDG